MCRSPPGDRRALENAGRKFEWKSNDDAPGGHHFNRSIPSLRASLAQKIYEFLSKYLRPGSPRSHKKGFKP